MKKLYTIIATALIGSQLFAGGIVTNTNQSAQYVRMLSRNASLGIDAVYFNPAGVARLGDGFHLSFNNQSIFQTKTVTSTFPLLHNNEFIGDVKAPLFPSFFAAYKKDKIGISFGFGPNGGGGSAEYTNGLPSFEMLVAMSDIPGMMTAAGIPTDDWDADIYFKGSSVYWGSQLNFTYEINEQFSAAVGVRMINAKNAYEGHIKTMVNPMHPLNSSGPGEMISTPLFFSTLATASYGAANSVQPLITGGVPNLEFARDNNLITANEYAALTGGLGANYVEGMAITTVQAMYNGAGVMADSYADATADIEVDATQSGMAFTPIISAMYSPNEKLDIAVKYELNTALTLKNDTDKDYGGMFKHDSSFRADIPAILAIGIGYKFSDKFRTQLSYTTYFDKQADWGGREDSVENNMWSISLGLEYDISEKFTGSIGYSRNNTGVGAGYQTDISYSNSSNTVGFGVQFRPMENLAIDLGVLYVMYDDYKVDYPIGYATPIYNATYAKTTSMVAIGVSYNF